ncbi:chitobiase/beta-hexosaminidase C-terminal domain-containing protein [Kribbella pittospori]|uniref:chitobiase/beta-hexosaminidase C-terminal domain-containing protein n=1 Tax=Kribbella pittospori TaxID=722689 RepID=UPI003B506790
MPVEVSEVAADPAAGTYSAAQSVHLSAGAGTTGAPEVLYTVDGSTPQALSRQYSGPIDVVADTTITARAFHVGLKPGPLSVLRYVIGQQPSRAR